MLLTSSGRVQLIDFGISWKEGEDLAAKKNDLWVETPEKMYFEVSTGPYRAPELLFVPRNYDPFAIDSWSLRATFAEFFTSVRLFNLLDDEDFGDEQSDSGDDSPGGLSKPAEPFIISKRLRIGDPTNRWARDSLFDSTRGEIGLAWSIFKTQGSPNETNWPVSVVGSVSNHLSLIHMTALGRSRLTKTLQIPCKSESGLCYPTGSSGPHTFPPNNDVSKSKPIFAPYACHVYWNAGHTARCTLVTL
ncbi:hypothetical protein EV424DRAFT_397289 [Suillus variegatus]|nr:hypothetical protein EV424DRAFT_397289 [Suillus variegatus]